ncbi:Zn-dependent protease (includes SpoIVFB) [Dethiosulfatibacter aminovorans DSM 17477]|uniref:Zn-dependent protease (Includes SpoIVFB) n=1 Tax=Dethiosulfatibacter aminovorans DSM 17477 TaxID=1121476 RepID=A0A1M6IP43_9FIRM|nr:site-2 protease family protein [Dethiosulfatibacter aminovorans]SHJ36206.1 Zn-dependent protease (includes SpoIVFB) [Dethiosulfatibacter aminovorans DSM 17477]
MLDSILSMLITLPAILIGISIHEYGHALAAVALGDDTPRYQGRLTLNPFKHLDPLGFICLLTVHFGWAKPVVINPRNFKNPKRDDIIVSLAGVVMNLITAIVFILIYKIYVENFTGFLYTEIGQILRVMLFYVVRINIVLMVFNLIPLPPLDGHHILQDIGGRRVYNFYHQYSQYIRLGLILLLITGNIGRIIGPPVYGIEDLLFSIIGRL